MKKALGIICILLSIACLSGVCLDIGYIVKHFFELIWWQLGLLFSLIPMVTILFAISITTGLDLIGFH